MISAIILTRNEENNIVDCLESVLWCSEIIIIDDYSKDRTVEIAENYKLPKIRVFKHFLNENFSNQRNYGLSKAKGDWALFIDADERLSNGLRGEIMDYVESDEKDTHAFYIKRRDYIWNKEIKHGEAGNTKLIRFARKSAGFWRGRVHETWDVKGKTGTFKMPLLHYPHQKMSNFLKEINYYSDLRSKELYDRGVRAGVWQIIAYPLLKFKYNYFLKLGFMDGIEGLILALMMSLHSFLVRAKLWTYSKRD